MQAAVPNWLREELIKKKSAIASTNILHSGAIQMEDADISFKKTDQADNQSLDSRMSIEDDDDDEVQSLFLVDIVCSVCGIVFPVFKYKNKILKKINQLLRCSDKRFILVIFHFYYMLFFLF